MLLAAAVLWAAYPYCSTSDTYSSALYPPASAVVNFINYRITSSASLLLAYVFIYTCNETFATHSTEPSFSFLTISTKHFWCSCRTPSYLLQVRTGPVSGYTVFLRKTDPLLDSPLDMYCTYWSQTRSSTQITELFLETYHFMNLAVSFATV